MTEQLQKKVDRAIKLIQSASKIAAANGCKEIEVAYSGGKDSDVILELTKMSGVPYRAIYKNTTIDPAGTIKHAKDMGCEIMRPRTTFAKLLETRGFPSRFARFCCAELKEYKVLDYAIWGIRREESKKRADRYKEPEFCRVYNKHEKTKVYLPILEWTKEDVAEFVAERNIQCHALYYDEQGFFHPERRLGCMCCPLTSRNKRIEAFRKHPNMVKLYIRGGQKWFENHKDIKSTQRFNNIYELFVFTVFCQNIKEFQERFGGNNLFGEKVDCKQFLEDYFKIKF